MYRQTSTQSPDLKHKDQETNIKAVSMGTSVIIDIVVIIMSSNRKIRIEFRKVEPKVEGSQISLSRLAQHVS